MADTYKIPDLAEVLSLLPHRPPFLLIDQITSVELHRKISGVKNITYNEWYFQGLPTSFMVVPASVLSEAIAQLGALLILLEEENRGKLIFFLGLDRVRFRKPVRPGDVVHMTAEIVRRKGRIGRLSVQARVKDQIVFEGLMQFALENSPAQEVRRTL
jgi:3-hydroxyacyl-[acyl-carrier-protein] dehydratase